MQISNAFPNHPLVLGQLLPHEHIDIPEVKQEFISIPAIRQI